MATMMSEMLGERVDTVDGLVRAWAIPVGGQFRLVEGRPLDEEAKRSGWEPAFDQLERVDCDLRDVFAVSRVEVGRRVVAEVHRDHDSGARRSWVRRQSARRPGGRLRWNEAIQTR